MLSGQFFDEMGSCACECIENLKTWPEIRKLIEAIISGYDGRDFVEEEIYFLAAYLEEIFIAAIWEESPDNTFYSCIANAIGDGTDFLEYLHMRELLDMTYDEFSECFGCNSAEDVAEELLGKCRGRAEWCACEVIEGTEKWPEIYDEALFEEKDTPENAADTLFDWLGDYLEEINIADHWQGSDGATFGECLIRVIGNGSDFLGYIQ